MNDPTFDSGDLEALRERWHREPTAQLALQLAEEYGRRGLPEQAVEVLEAALGHRPTHLSARVALGRYRLDLGQVERGVEALEGVVAADPTHLVANKLLVKGYSDLGELQKAKDRLDLYRLLNESDPEIGSLGQLVASAAAREETREEESFADVEAPPEADAGRASRRSEVRPPEDVLVQETAPVDEPAEKLPEVSVEGLRAEPFPDLWQELDETSYRAGLLGEIFGSGELAEEDSESPVEPTARSQGPRTESSAGAAEPPVDETASVTLADLYSGQGHPEEAIRTLRDVLRREPGNDEARTRLAALVGGEEGRVTAFDLLESGDFSPGVALEERRARLLRSYLDRIGSGEGAADV